MPQLSLDLLKSSLSVTDKPVKVFAFGETNWVSVPAAMALAMVSTGDYVGGGNSRRCKWIRPLSPPPPSPREDPRDRADWSASDAFMGQTFVAYPQNRKGAFAREGCGMGWGR